MNKPSVLLIESNGLRALELEDCLSIRGIAVLTVSDCRQCLESVQKSAPDLVVICSPKDAHWDSLEVAKLIRRENRTIPLILINHQSSEARVLAALKVGINDYFTAPFSDEGLLASVTQLLSLDSLQGTHKSRSETNPNSKMVGESFAIHQIKKTLSRIAASNSTVLITGETGTGNELAADIIHRMSSRQQNPMVCINCTALPENLVESELFGYERGAFTGASVRTVGKLEAAEGGSVFLDEIGDMNPIAQAKILRVIERKEVYRLGGKRAIPLNIRFIAATNQDLESLVKRGAFRKDLYYRLNVARLNIPPLRKRTEDIPPLLNHFLRELNGQFGQNVEGFSKEAFDSLLSHDWPGNVRELKNLIEAVFINLSSERIGLDDLPEHFISQLKEIQAPLMNERDRILSALITTNWNKSKAAQKLRWSRMTLYRKLIKHNISEAQ